MRVLANDGLADEGISMFEEAGIEVDTTKKGHNELLVDLSHYNALLVRSKTKVTKEVIEAGKNTLRVIGRAGVGYSNVDVAAATENDIIVMYAPHGNTNSTAEHALGLMHAVARNVPQAFQTMKAGEWSRKQFQGTTISDKVLGIIGCGRIGRRLAELVRGYDMTVIGYDPFPSDKTRIKHVSLEEVLKESDFISVHTPGTEAVISHEELDVMKETAYLINTSRGSSVDESALYSALQKGKIAGAGIDVYTNEPESDGSPFSHQLLRLSNVVVTPHLGASSKEGQKATAIEIADSVINYLLRGEVTNAVNVQREAEGEARTVYSVLISHEDKPGMFAQIDEVFAKHDINIQEHRSVYNNNGVAQTTYLLHGTTNLGIDSELRAIKGVRIVRT